MVRRLFWIGVGAVAGAYVVRKATRAAQAVSPSGLAGSISQLADAVREFGAEVREGMAEREVELREALGIEPADETNEKA